MSLFRPIAFSPLRQFDRWNRDFSVRVTRFQTLYVEFGNTLLRKILYLSAIAVVGGNAMRANFAGSSLPEKGLILKR